MIHKLDKKTLRWEFIKSLEPPRVVHLRTTHLISKENMYAQVTVRLHTQQVGIIFDFFLEIFYFQNGDGQTVCVVRKTFRYKAVIRGPRVSATGVNAKWACLNLLRIALTILKKQVNVSMNECQPAVCLTLPPTSVADVDFA